MKFREWLEQTLSKADPRLYGEKEDAMEAAWEASKAEERERCLSLCRQVASLPHAKSPVAWTTAAGYLAEQIRKGE